jgi:hypothetical protein
MWVCPELRLEIYKVLQKAELGGKKHSAVIHM